MIINYFFATIAAAVSTFIALYLCFGDSGFSNGDKSKKNKDEDYE